MSNWKSIKISQFSQQTLEKLTEDVRPEPLGGQGGFSISIRGEKPKSGYMVSDLGTEQIHDFNILKPHLSVPSLKKFIRTNSGLLQPSEKFFGGWLGDDGKLYLDVSSNVKCEHGPGQICEHRWDAYFKMVQNKQDAIFHMDGPDEGKYLSAEDAREEFPDDSATWEQHLRDMEKYRQQREARIAAERATSGPKKHYFRIGPDATDEELLEILKQIAEK